MSGKAARRALVLVAVVVLLTLSLAVTAFANPGITPDSGDGIGNFFGLEAPFAPGSAPNAGDGIPDGSGF